MTRDVGSRLVLLAALGACVGPGHLPSHCSAEPSAAAWDATAQRGRLEGMARDLDEGLPIRGLRFLVPALDRASRTDSLGHFQFDDMPPGRYEIRNDSGVYLARHDTIIVENGAGVRMSVRLATRHDLLTHCSMYHP